MKTEKPQWLATGPVENCLNTHGNLLGMLPNKVGDLTIVTAEMDGTSLMFSQQNASGEGTPITVEISNQSQVDQIEAGLAAVASGSHKEWHDRKVSYAISSGRM